MKSNKKATVLEEISDPLYLKKAWLSLNKANKESRGLNNETIEEFHSNLDTNITELSKKLRTSKYTFNSVRGVLIPKKETGKFRPLRIQDIGDRLVCKAISMRLDEILTPIFKLDNEVSFAYRKNKGICEAITSLVKFYKQGYKIILEADIIKFFDKVDRKILLEKITKNLPDNSLNKIIEDGLSQEVGNINEHTVNAHYFADSTDGIPQGNALSPLFANVYLSEFDQEIVSKGYKLVRYADDFVILCKTNEEAKTAYQVAKSFLENKLKLTIHELGNGDNAKTKIVSPAQEKFQFLSVRFDGKHLWVDKNKVIQLKTKIMEITDVSNKFDLITVLTKTRNLLEGWLASFKFVDLERDIEEIDNHIDMQLYIVFRKYDFNIKTKYLRQIKNKNGGESSALTLNQRQKTGVKTCKYFLSQIERNKISC